MATNQEFRQASVRAVTSIAAGPFNARMLAWINGNLGTSYTGLPEAMHAFAVNRSAPDWDGLGTFDPAAP